MVLHASSAGAIVTGKPIKTFMPRDGTNAVNPRCEDLRQIAPPIVRVRFSLYNNGSFSDAFGPIQAEYAC
jgi:hypothetical protein